MSNPNFFQLTEKDLAYLKSHWQNLARDYTTDEAIVQSVFASLVEHYSEKHRAYHNLSHIKALLSLSDSFTDKMQNPNGVWFAIWFHDGIYETQKHDNEERSADFARQALFQLSVPLETLSVVQEMILATKHHQADNRLEDLNLFLDLDLSVLGFEENIYQAYSQAIREEYSWVPEAMYKEARKKVLTNFLDRPVIYFTKPLADRFEAAARHNIKNEISQLSNTETS
jgi:predicted metal-dependent HD superfamily phosphohydrolase